VRWLPRQYRAFSRARDAIVLHDGGRGASAKTGAKQQASAMLPPRTFFACDDADGPLCPQLFAAVDEGG
jgi:hypothetical protein